MSGSVKSTKGKKTGFLIAAIVLSLLSIGYLCLTIFIRPISSWTPEDTVEYSATFSGSKRTDNGYLISTEEYLFSLLLQEDVLTDPTAIDELRPGEKIYFRFLKGTVDLVINEPYLTEMTAITFRTEDREIVSFESQNAALEKSVQQLKITGACATAVAAAQAGLAGRRCHVEMDGGTLGVEWREADGHVYLSGPAEFVFDGEIMGIKD